MATAASPTVDHPTEHATAPQDIANANRADTQLPSSSTPVEMTNYPSKPAPTSGAAHDLTTTPQLRTLPSALMNAPDKTLTPNAVTTEPTPAMTSTGTPAPHLDRAYSTAIGPSSDSHYSPTPLPKDEVAGPILLITLLLNTGARHPFKLDPKYLSKRNVELPGNDPFSLSVYKLKELILREWREEWESKPSSPSSIRLIYFGKLLDDKAPLRDSKFSHDSPNVVHMTIKPQDFVDDEDTKGGKGGLASASETHERSPGCRCIIM